MFPHKFDRYRLAGYILRLLRKSLGITQAVLAKKLSVAQVTISHLEHFNALEQAANLGHRPVARDKFIRIVVDGLGLSGQEVNALLWLIEGEEYEPHGKTTGRQNDGHAPRDNDPEILRARVMHLLKGAHGLARKIDKVSVRTHTGWEEEHQIKFRMDLLAMEGRPGQRLLVSKYPSFLACPNNIYDKSEWSVGGKVSAAARDKIRKITDRRRKIYQKNLKLYGERCIHSTASIERYLREGFQHYLDPEERRSHVRNLMTMLGEYEHFEVALAKEEPEMELAIKCGWATSLRGTARDVRSVNPDTVICGPLYIYWDDVRSVYAFVLDFEQAWDRIPQERRSKKYVLEQLEGLLAAAAEAGEEGVPSRPAQQPGGAAG